MKKNNFIKIIGFVIILLITYSCEKNNEQFNENNETGEIKFSISALTKINKKTLKSIHSGNIEAISSIVVSVEDEKGVQIYDKKKIELYYINGEFISSPLSLTTGNYSLTEFFVIDNDNNIIYLTPKEKSAKAYLVENPVPLCFKIEENKVNKIIPQVISVGNSLPADFGYTTFSFDIIETFDFLISVFIYDSTIYNFKLTSADLSVLGENNRCLSKKLDPITNTITVKGDFDTYIINITKEGYYSYIDTFKIDSLKAFNKNYKGPLTIILEKNHDFKPCIPVIVWWDDNEEREKYGLLNIRNGTVEAKGVIDDLLWWQRACCTDNEKLVALGTAASVPSSENTKMYVCDIETGTLINKFSFTKMNTSIAGFYKEKVVAVWWDGTNEKFGLVNLYNGNVDVRGNVGDLQLWQGACGVNYGKLVVIGTGSSVSSAENTKMYVCDIETGTLINKFSFTKKNVTIAGFYKEKVVAVWWDGTNEKFGLVNLNNGNIDIKGNIGDLRLWKKACGIYNKKLVAIGAPDSSPSTNNLYLYVCNIETGALIDKYDFSKMNAVIAKNY